MPRSVSYTHLTLADSLAIEEIGRLVRQAFQVREGKPADIALQVGPEQGELFRLFFRQNIHDVIGKVEVIRSVDFEIFYKILIGGKMCIRDRSLQMARETYHAHPSFFIQLIVVSGILQWKYQIQIYLGKKIEK